MKILKGFYELIFILGVYFMLGRDDKYFCKLIDVVVVFNGDFFVLDGYL